MKTAFFLVLLANLTLLMYEFHLGAFDQVTEAPAPDAKMLREAIILADEQEGEVPSATPTALAEVLDQGSQQGAAAELDTANKTSVLQPNAEAPAFVCYEAGPFMNEQILKAWSKVVNEGQGDLAPVTREAQEIIDHLVLYPAPGGKEDLKAAMQALRDHGISDAYPLVTGDNKGYISLGAFHRETRAAVMQKDLREKGIEAVIKPRFKQIGQKYALFKGPGTIADRLGDLAKKYPNIQVKALPGTHPDCLGNPLDQSRLAAMEGSGQLSGKEMKLAQGSGQAVLTENPFAQADAGALSSAIPSTENAPLKNAKQGIEELPAQPERKQLSGAVGASPVRLVCYEAGPFPNEQSISVWQKKVTGEQGLMKMVFREGKVISDYLVLYPSVGGADETKADMQMLRDRGLNDAWPLPSGDERGQISLGVFSREENALQMQTSLLDKGVKSVVKPRYKSKRQKYALIAGAESIAGSLQTLETLYPGINLRRVADAEQDCPKRVSVQP